MMKFGYKAAIFDMDGTLLESMGFWRSLLFDYLDRYGVARPTYVDPAVYALELKDTAAWTQREFFPEFEENRVYREWLAIIDHNYKHVLQPKPKAGEYLRTLKEQGVGICIATLTDREHVLFAMERLGWMPYLDFILTVAEVGKNKREPDLFLQCAQRFSAAPEECCVFEDSPYAIRTAKNAGFACVGVLDANTKEAALRQECSRVFGDYEELLSGKLEIV